MISGNEMYLNPTNFNITIKRMMYFIVYSS